MVWTVKLIAENSKEIRIAYSCEDDLSLDGIILYDKNKKEFTVEKYSKNASEYQSKKTIQFLWRLINTDKLSEKPYRICTG